MEEDRHFLADRQFTNVQVWRDWKKEWSNSTEVKILLSLLHCGFKMQAIRSEAIERIQFYLQTADLHARIMTRDFGSSEVAALASKAFQVLCTDFFGKPQHEVDDLLLLRQNAVVTSIMHFFRPEKKVGLCWLENLPPGEHRFDPRHRIIAEKFILQYLPVVWEKVTRSEIASGYSIEVVNILLAMERLSNLLGRPYCGKELSDSFNFTAMKHLRELAQDPQYIPPSDSRRPGDKELRTPEEAAAFDSRPAQIYLLLRNREEQFKRLKDLRDAEGEVRAATQRLEGLQR